MDTKDLVILEVTHGLRYFPLLPHAIMSANKNGPAPALRPERVKSDERSYSPLRMAELSKAIQSSDANI